MWRFFFFGDLETLYWVIFFSDLLNRCQVGQDPQILLTWPKFWVKFSSSKEEVGTFKRSSQDSIDDFRYHLLLLQQIQYITLVKLHPPTNVISHVQISPTKNWKIVRFYTLKKMNFSGSWRVIFHWIFFSIN